MKLLADTSALLALLFRDDRNHLAAAAFLRSRPEVRFLMTELVLSEVVTRLRARAGAARAVAAARELTGSGRYELLFIDALVLRGALEKMSQFADKRLSLTDCASFDVMERLGLEAAFTFDHDFRDCGFRMLPVETKGRAR
ncbi:MAG: PIN domain-containing protein [Thermoanaerobaculia bacterium]